MMSGYDDPSRLEMINNETVGGISSRAGMEGW